jgi:dTDP-4-dehydrorhamnose reductase
LVASGSDDTIRHADRRKEANMNCVQLIGHSAPLSDNLAVSLADYFDRVERTIPAAVEPTLDQIRLWRPSWVVYMGATAANSWEPATCEHDEPQFVGELARCCSEVGAQLTLISSDAAFVGPRLFHDESEAPAADVCSQRIVTIEQAALAASDAARQPLIVRTHTFGWSAAGESFAERLWSDLSCGEPVEVDAASYATPILASDLANLLVRSHRAKLQGLLHIAGAERTSALRFAQELAAMAGFDRHLARPKAHQAELDQSQPPLLRESSLGSRLVRRELGVALPLLRVGLARFVEQATDGHCEQIRAAAMNTLTRAA